MYHQPLVTFVFFVSGAAGLMFEIVWFHRCGLVFGNSIWAATIVLSSFMGGLAIGNALAARITRGRLDRLRLYAALEAIVGASGIALTYALPPLGTLVARLSAGASDLTVNVIRLGMAFVLMIVPTSAMGATLPVLVGGLTRTRLDFGRTVGRLYGWNTLGAVAGVVAAETLLIDTVGIAGSAWIAALLNFFAAAAATWTARGRSAPATSEGETEVGADERTALPILTAAFLAGAALLSLEIVWLRFLSMYVLTTTLAMSLMLAVVLAGIGIGGVVTSRWLARGRVPVTARPAAAIAFLASAATMAAYWTFQWTTSGAQIGGWPRVLWLATALAAPTATLSGALFTLLAAPVNRSIASPARASAWLTLANTTGAMCGPAITTFVLLPAIGMERTLFAVATIYAAIGIVALAGESAREWRTRPLGAAAAAAGVALIFFPFGTMAGTYFPRAAAPYAADGSQIVATRESPSETIFLMQQQWLGRRVYDRLVTNGFSMTGTGTAGVRYMRYFAYWPMLLHAAPIARALVICYGVGVTAGAVLDMPSVQRLDVAEISPAIVETSDIVYATGDHPLHDGRVRLHLEDGRFFLQSTRDRFDLITGEPPPPRTPGAVSIYTREYFQLIREHLAEGGITTYWLPVARPDPGTDVNTIVRAFCDVFADCSLWNATPSDFMLVGTRGAGRRVSDGSFGGAWSDVTLAARLRDAGFEQPEQIGATFLGDADYLRALTQSTPPVTDDFPQRLRPVPARPSLSDPRYRDDAAVMRLYSDVLDTDRARRAFAASPLVDRLWPASLARDTLPFFAYQRILNRVFREGPRPLLQIEDLHLLLTGTTLRTLPLWLLGSDAVKQRIAEASTVRSAATEYVLGLAALSARDYLRAAAHLGEAERRGAQDAAVRALQVYAMCVSGDTVTARQLAAGAPARTDEERHFWGWMNQTFGVNNGS
jgi:spermidine synthase